MLQLWQIKFKYHGPDPDLDYTGYVVYIAEEV